MDLPVERPTQGVMVVYEVEFIEGRDPLREMEEAIAALRGRVQTLEKPWVVDKAAWNQIEITAPATYGDDASIKAATDAVADLLEPGELSFRLVAEPASRTNEDVLTPQQVDAFVREFPELSESDARQWQWFTVPQAAEVLNAEGLNDLAETDREFEERAPGVLQNQGLVGTAYRRNISILLSNKPGEFMIEGRDFKVIRIAESLDDMGMPALSIRLDTAGGKRMDVMTKKNRGNQMAALVDNKVVVVAKIQSQIGTYMMISGADRPSTRRLLFRVNGSSEKLPVEIVTPALTVEAFKRPAKKN